MHARSYSTPPSRRGSDAGDDVVMSDQEHRPVDVRSRIAALNGARGKTSAVPSQSVPRNARASEGPASSSSNTTQSEGSSKQEQVKQLNVKDILALYSNTKGSHTQQVPQLPPRTRSGAVSENNTGSSLGSDSTSNQRSATSVSYAVRKPAVDGNVRHSKQPEVPVRPKIKTSVPSSDDDQRSNRPTLSTPPPLPERSLRQSTSSSSIASLTNTAAIRTSPKRFASSQKSRTLATAAPPPLVHAGSTRRETSTTKRRRRRDQRDQMTFACEAQTSAQRRYEKVFDDAKRRRDDEDERLSQATVVHIWQRSKLDAWFLLHVWQQAHDNHDEQDDHMRIDKPSFVRAMAAIDAELHRRQRLA